MRLYETNGRQEDIVLVRNVYEYTDLPLSPM